jgi:hypothetical protein
MVQHFSAKILIFEVIHCAPAFAAAGVDKQTVTGPQQQPWKPQLIVKIRTALLLRRRWRWLQLPALALSPAAVLWWWLQEQQKLLLRQHLAWRQQQPPRHLHLHLQQQQQQQRLTLLRQTTPTIHL